MRSAAVLVLLSSMGVVSAGAGTPVVLVSISRRLRHPRFHHIQDGTVRGISSVYVSELQATVEGDKVRNYRANVKISFVLEKD